MKTISLIFHMLQGCCSGLSMLIDYLNGYVGDLHLEFRWEAQTEKIRFESHESGRTQPQRTKKEEDQVWELEETSTLRQRPREMSGCRKLREIERMTHRGQARINSSDRSNPQGQTWQRRSRLYKHRRMPMEFIGNLVKCQCRQVGWGISQVKIEGGCFWLVEATVPPWAVQGSRLEGLCQASASPSPWARIGEHHRE